jgi:two-component system sensor histidine kinase/response regulator
LRLLEISMNDSLTILVVDDDPLLLDLMVETLNTIGYNAEGVLGGKEALEYLEDNDVQLLITDIKMPEMDGIELSQLVKKLYPKLPVIFISAAFTPAVLQRIEGEPFLAKPFRISQVEALIKNSMEPVSDTMQTKSANSILVVDDDDGFRIMLMENLKISGYNVCGASDAIKAVEQLKQGGISAVITDFKMPGMDGLSLSRYVRQQWPALPVILMTAYINVNENPEVQFNDADGFLMKPFKIDSITGLLEMIKREKNKS